MTPPSEAAAGGTGGGQGNAGGQRGRPAPDYPVMLSLAGRPCLVVGGGPVAARKARGLVAAGAVVTVVAPRASAPMAELVGEGSVALELRPYGDGEAGHYDLAVTATGDPSVDGLVVADATAAGVLVNSADGARPGTIQLPAVLRRGPVTVAVATGGGSPALARWLRDRIADALPPQLATVADLVDEARNQVRASGRSTDSVDWSRLLDRVVLPLVEADRIDEARSALREAWEQSLTDPGGKPAEAPG